MLINILIACVIAGLVLWALKMLPIDDRIKQIGSIAVIVVLVLWLLKLVGALTGSPML